MLDFESLGSSFGGILLIFVIMGLGAYIIGDYTNINPKLMGIIGLVAACFIVYETQTG